ncbi:hypothetical protein [Pseudarthrobacter chlorophenolicus]|nr:hypothetical protein [Pseudarthrobacter chlorophenolicus]
MSLEGRQLQNALEVYRFPRMKDERDDPGSVGTGRSRLDQGRGYEQERTHPVPLYKSADIIRISRVPDAFFPTETVDVDVIQVTRTAMSPPVARAFIEALVDDPTHPFVLAHVNKDFDLNGSDSWLTVGGPALAIPLTWVEPRDARAARSKDYVQPKPDWTEVDLHVHVGNAEGVGSEDLIRAARRHESLGGSGITVGAVDLVSLEPVAHRVGEGGLTGNEVPMFKLVYDRQTIGLYGSAGEAQEALTAELSGGDRYFSRGTLYGGEPRTDFQGRYSVQGCLTLNGEEVEPDITTELVETKAVVRVGVATLDPGVRREHAGWMLVWQAFDWHRNPEYLTQYLDDNGDVLSQRRSGWHY